MSVYVGLDCGGSSCRIVAVGEGGDLLFQGQSGAANLASTPENRLRRNLGQAARGCPRADFVCGCFAGLIDDDARELGLRELRALFPRAKVRAEPDYYAAFFAAPPQTDVVVIAGTGSLVCSRDGDQLRKTGGGGYLLGDEGSAFQYGRDALRAYIQSPSSASEALRQTVERHFEGLPIGGVITSVYRAPTPAGLLAKFSKPLASDARAGVAYAQASLRRNSAALAEVVHRHLSQHFQPGEKIVLCLAGGLWKGSSVFRDAFLEAWQTYPDWPIETVRPSEAPIHGAVKMAREMNGGN